MNQSWIRFLPAFIKEKVEGRDGLQKAIANTGWLFADKVVRMGVGLVVGVWIARYLGPRQFGLLNYATAFVTLFATVGSLGLDSIAVRDIVRYPENKNEILGTSFLLRLAGGSLALVLAVASALVVRPLDTLTHWLIFIIVAGTVFQSFDAIDYWFQSQVQSKYTVIAKNTAFLATAVLKIVFLINHASLIAFAIAGLIETALGSAGLLVAYKKHGYYLKSWSASLGWAQRLLRDSWPLILSGMVIAVYMKIDQIMLGQMTGDREVGIYSAAVSISEVWYFIPTVVTSSVYPGLIKAYYVSEKLFYERLKMIMGYFFWGALFLSIIITLFSPDIIRLLYGSKYADAAGVLSIHIYSGIIVSMSVIFSLKYSIDGTTRISFYGAFAGAVSNVLLNLWLIKIAGAQGAAVATVISYIFPICIQTILFDKRIGLTFVESIYYPVRIAVAKISGN